MLRNHTGFRKWPLRGDAGQVQALTPGEPNKFDLKNLPLLTGRYANYAVGMLLTATGTASIAAEGNTVIIDAQNMTRLLYDSFDLQGAWHGRPIAFQHWRGATLPIIEHVSAGYQWFSRRMQPLRITDGDDIDFRHNVFLPLGHFLGEKPHHTAQLALFYKDAEQFINAAQASVATAFNSALSFSDVSLQCSMILLPEPEVRLGPATEWLEFRQASQPNNDEVDLDSLGNATALEGVEPGGGIDFAMALTDVRGQLGSFSLDTVSRFSCPFRDQTQTNHMDPFLAELDSCEDILSLDGVPFVTLDGNATASFGVDFERWPYVPAITPSINPGDGLPLNGRGFPIVSPSRELEVTKIQVVEGTQTYFLTATFAGTNPHRTLVHQFKSWTPAKIADAKRLIIESGIALAVEGTNDLDWQVKTINKNAASIDRRKARFLPLRLGRVAK